MDVIQNKMKLTVAKENKVYNDFLTDGVWLKKNKKIWDLVAANEIPNL